MPWIEVWHKGQNTGQCRSCQAPITWARTVKNNRAMPFDGQLVAVSTKHSAEWEPIDVIDTSVCKPHWVVCPQADDWRKK